MKCVQFSVFIAIVSFAGIGIGAVGEPSLSAGGSGWALRLDGMDDFVLLEQDLPPEPWTIEMWVKPESLSHGDGTSLVTFESKGTLLCRTSMVGGSRILQVVYNGEQVWYKSTNQDGVTTDEVTPSAAVGQLYHWALTKTENTSRVFLNGVLSSEVELSAEDYPDASGLASTPWFLGARMVLVGRKWVTDDRNFGGVLDEVRWWKGERSEAELQKYMHRPIPSGDPNLVKQWSFDKKDGDSVAGSYHLGGGSEFNSPTWIPSPVTSHGGSVAISTRSTASQSEVPVCAILTPAESGVSATFTLVGSSTLGTLAPSTSAMVETTEGAPAGSTRFCTNVTFAPSSAGFEEVDFEVKALLSDGVTELTSTQSISILTSGNTPPSAGAALAVTTDGVENYLSLGSWEMADDWSMSLWLDPLSTVDDVWIIAQHASSGTNMFLFGFFGIGYYIRMSCLRGCSTSANVARRYPDVTGDVLILNSGRTADEIESRKVEAHHVALTFHCISRGNESTSPSGILKLYQDGLLIAEDEWPLCMGRPLLPEAYSDEDWAARPTPWEMGQEYDGGTLDEYLENVAVVPSNFMHSIFDEFVVWNATLSGEEVLANAHGDLVRSADINVRYTFDLDDPEDCAERQLWDKTLSCHELNEANGNTAPSEVFPWTNAPIGDVESGPSPFHLVAGSPVYKTLAAGSCSVATLQGADADGDSLTFRLKTTLVNTASQNLTLDDPYLTFCDNNADLAAVESLMVYYDACDSFGECASWTSNLGTVVFHILPRGPTIVAFQALTKDRVMRIVFSAATNCPMASESADLLALFSLSDGTIGMKLGDWEEGCQALRITPVNASRLFDASALEATITVLYGGLLRDEDELSYPSTSVSPTIVVVTCATGELLLPGMEACSMCEPGYVPGENEITLVDECQPCPVGTAGVGECSACSAGTFANTTALTECLACPLGHSCGELKMDVPEACLAGYYQGEVGQSSCTRCPRGRYSAEIASTACTSCPEGKTTDGTGFSSLADCECPANFYEFGSRCIACRKGAVCNGYGQEPEAAEGYQLFSVTADKLELFLCSSEPHRCPGGPVGTCAEGRTGIACAVCRDNWTPGSDGTCSACSEEDHAVFSVIALVAVCALIALYSRVSKHNTIRMKHEALLAMTAIAQILFVFQVAGVLARLTITWPEPMFAVYKFLMVFTVDLSMFRVGCVAAASELTLYLLKLAIVPVFVVGLGLCHCVASLLRGRSFLIHREPFLGSVGIFMTSLYAGLTSAISSPFQCFSHPNDRWTMKAAEGVICWEGGEHTTMIVFAIAALSMLFGFFAWVVTLIQVYPRRMAAGDVRFLNTYSFLFLRVRPAARWFVVAFLARNGIIALIPTIPNAYWQAFAMIVTFGVSFSTTLHVLPWRLMSANFFDIFTCAAFQANVVVAIPFVATSEDVTMLSEVALGFVLLCLAAAPLLLLRWLLIKAANRRKAYGWFLCHQKASAGAFARMLKLFLVERHARGVFLDSDDLVDLAELFRFIECETETLVALCTKELLLSPWCTGEIAVSRLWKVKLSPVHFPDFELPSERFIENLAEYVPMTVLTESGLALQDVQAGLRHLRTCPGHELLDDFNEASLSKLMDSFEGVQDQVHNGQSFKTFVSQRSVNVMSLKSSGGSISLGLGGCAICVDCGQTEALAAGYVLLKMLRSSPVADRKPYLLRADQQNVWSDMTEVAVVLCTAGCYGSVRFLHALMFLVKHQIESVLPVVVANDFVFPNASFYEDLEGRVSQICADAGVFDTPSLLTPFTRALFRKITSRFSVLDSSTILQTQVQLISARLMNRAALLTEYTHEECPAAKDVLGDILCIYHQDMEQAMKGDLTKGYEMVTKRSRHRSKKDATREFGGFNEAGGRSTSEDDPCATNSSGTDQSTTLECGPGQGLVCSTENLLVKW